MSLEFCIKVDVWLSFSSPDIPSSDSESFNPSLWEEQRKQRAQVAFECDEDKDERETPPRVSTPHACIDTNEHTHTSTHPCVRTQPRKTLLTCCAIDCS